MKRASFIVAASVLALVVIGYTAFNGVGQDTSPKKKPPTYKVKKGPFKVVVTAEGIFEAMSMTPVTFRPEAWTTQTAPLLVDKAVAHGATVQKGAPLVWLNLVRFDKAIRDLEEQQTVAEAQIRLAEKELPLLERATPQDLAAAQRAKKIADEDLQRFLKHDRDYSKKAAEFQVKSSRNYLEYAQEELRQLEKMYKANDLTEETEEIVLRRYRNSVESAAFYLKMSEKQRDDLFKITLPRRDKTLHEQADRAALAWAKAQATLPLLLAQKRLDLNKMKYDRDKTATKLAKLRRDRAALELKAPVSGIVYYGRCVRGKWTTQSAMANKLRPGGSLSPNEVIFTIVRSSEHIVRAEVEEKHLQHLQASKSATVIPTGFPDYKLSAVVESVSLVPVGQGKYLANLALKTAKINFLRPGMTCSIKLVPYQKANALTVPASAVFADELDDGKHYVYLPGSGGNAKKRHITVGKKSGDRIEVLQGLQEGDEILQKKPDEDGQSSAGNKEGKN